MRKRRSPPAGLKTTAMHDGSHWVFCLAHRKHRKHRNTRRYTCAKPLDTLNCMCQHLDFLWFPWFLCDTKRTSRNFFLSTDSTEFRHVLQVASLLLVGIAERFHPEANASVARVICLGSCLNSVDINTSSRSNYRDARAPSLLGGQFPKRSLYRTHFI